MCKWNVIPHKLLNLALLAAIAGVVISYSDIQTDDDDDCNCDIARAVAIKTQL